MSATEAGGGGAGTPEWLSTHPNPVNREGSILEMARTAEVAADPPRVEREEYISRLDGLTFGDNPREGYFLEERFYHPDMRFQMSFPPGWQTANTRQAVQALSPQEDAVFALTLGEGSEPGDALRSFLAQEGVEGSGVSQSSVNGLPAASADFRFSNGQESLAGRIAFVSHGGVLFQLLSNGTPSAWDGHRSTVGSALSSFRPLSDETYLNVQPARIRVITVGRASSLNDFLAREGVQDQGEQVRLLNRLEGNPTLRAGQILKVPTGGLMPGGD